MIERSLISDVNESPLDRMFFTHLIAMPFTYREIFMFINFESTTKASKRTANWTERKCCVHFGWLLFFIHSNIAWRVFSDIEGNNERLLQLSRRVNNNNGDAVNLIRREND